MCLVTTYLNGGLVGDVEREHGEAPGRVLVPELLELRGGPRRAARGDDAALVAPPQQLPHLHRIRRARQHPQVQGESNQSDGANRECGGKETEGEAKWGAGDGVGGLTNSRPIPRDAPCTMATPAPAAPEPAEGEAEKALAATASLAIAAPPLIGGFGLDPASMPQGLERWVGSWIARSDGGGARAALVRDSHGSTAGHVFLPSFLSLFL
jgi:hypothetical protein